MIYGFGNEVPDSDLEARRQLTDAQIEARIVALSAIDEPTWGDLQEALGHLHGFRERALKAEAAVLKARKVTPCVFCNAEWGHAPDCLRAELEARK